MELLIKKTRIRGSTNLNVSENFFDAFNERVVEEFERCMERAKKNGRSTVMDRDV